MTSTPTSTAASLERDIDGLAAHLSVFPTLREALFAAMVAPATGEAMLEERADQGGDPGASGVPGLRRAVAEVSRVRGGRRNEPLLEGAGTGAKPKEVIRTLAEDCCSAGEGCRCSTATTSTSGYDYWDEACDEVYLVAAEGWKEAAKPRGVIDYAMQKIWR